MHTPSIWLRQFRDGDSVAAQRLWETYYPKLIMLARRRLEGRNLIVCDEEDVALSAFKSFWFGITKGRFPDLNDRDDLWRLLVTITLHKVSHAVRDAGRQKRASDSQRARVAPPNEDEGFLDELVGQEPTPELAAEIAEQCELLLRQLPSKTLVDVAVLKMEGYTNKEIADQWGKSERTVERKLMLVRNIWSKHVEP
jgi:DNA-directed RNA polymerase specialized sigma24 family protein